MRLQDVREEFREELDDIDVPVFRVPWYRLTPGNWALYGWRRVFGFSMAAEFRGGFGLSREQIRIVEGMPEPFEDATVKHEAQHSRQLKGESPEWTPARFMVTLTSGAFLVLATFFGAAGIKPLVNATVFGSAGFGLAAMVLESKALEDDANEEIDWSDVADDAGIETPEGLWKAVAKWGERCIGYGLTIPLIPLTFPMAVLWQLTGAARIISTWELPAVKHLWQCSNSQGS